MNLLQEHFSLFITQFHWLRPWWLLALLPLVALSVALWKQKKHAYQWQDIIAPELLPYLLDGNTMTPKKTLLWALIFGWLVATVALAGPSWIKRPTPVEKNQNALVILLDLSISMYSEDIKPSRIARARLKITDILRERKDGQTAIVVYAGEAHTVTPLSDDSATIISLLPSLQPNIMPLQGSNTEAAVARGIQLLKDVGAAQGDLLLVTDGIVPDAFAKIRELVAGTNVHLNILGVGTNQPTPVPGSNGSFLHDKQGAILTTQLNSSELNDLAAQVGGRYHEISNTNNDIDYLIPDPEKNAKNNPTLERDFDQWFDQGHWLVFLLLPIVLFSFRRGFILMLICIPLIGLSPSPAYAFTWDDLWLTKDQQAARELSKGDVKAAAEKFETPDWKASAEYRTGNYSAAAEHYAKSDTAEAHYNRGNALAKAGKLEDAIKAYDAALSRDAALDDAKKNKALVEKLLQQQKDQEKKDQNEKDQNSSEQNSSDQNTSNQNSSNQSNSSQNGSSQSQDQNQQSSNGGSASAQNQSDAHSSAGNHSQQSMDGAQSSSATNSAQTNSMNASSGGSSSSGQMTQNSSQSSEDENEQERQAAAPKESDLTEEQKQALEQWLRRVPDDPGGLLRNKFKWQYLQNRQKKADGEFVAPSNNADQRL